MDQEKQQLRLLAGSALLPCPWRRGIPEQWADLQQMQRSASRRSTRSVAWPFLCSTLTSVCAFSWVDLVGIVRQNRHTPHSLLCFPKRSDMRFKEQPPSTLVAKVNHSFTLSDVIIVWYLKCSLGRMSFEVFQWNFLWGHSTICLIYNDRIRADPQTGRGRCLVVSSTFRCPTRSTTYHFCNYYVVARSEMRRPMLILVSLL